MAMLRVAAAQFAAGTDVDENLAACCRLIDEAGDRSVEVLVLPEFSNHCAWYDNADHAWQVAVSIDGPFVAAVAAHARTHAMHVQLNVSLRSFDVPGSALTASNLLVGPDGTIVGRSDKCVLMGNENTYFEKATAPNPVIDLPFGRVGLYACMEGVITEPPRSLAVRGAVLLLNSLNSFALDEASLHIPVRAAENGVFVVAANKIGPIVPIEKIEVVAAMLKVPSAALHGAGESQIVGPDGTVLAKGSPTDEEVVVADIDLSVANLKSRPDGTHRMRARRPSVYVRLAEGECDDIPPAADHLTCAVAIPRTATTADIEAVVREAVAKGAQLIVLPELCGATDPAATDAAAFIPALRQVAANSVVVMSIREGDAHVGVVVTSAGVVARQPQIHRSERHGAWVHRLGDALVPVDLPFGRLAVIVGDDLVFPEVARLAGVLGCSIVAAPIAIAEGWETQYGLIERSAENRLCLVAASASPGFDGGIITSLPRELTLWAERSERRFDGTINVPDITRVPPGPGVTTAVVTPSNASNKVISKGTDLLAGRPWRVMQPLVT